MEYSRAQTGNEMSSKARKKTKSSRKRATTRFAKKTKSARASKKTSTTRGAVKKKSVKKKTVQRNSTSRKKSTTRTAKKRAYPGLFVTVEGGEGTGKSTQLQILKEQLEAKGHQVIVTREPGGSPKADAIRELILDDRLVGVDPMAELMLYQASRAQHVAEVILPALEAGKVVLCDRYTDSSLVYQGKARGLSAKFVEAANEISTQGLRPDITFFFDLDPRIGLGRIGSRGVIDRMERERFEFHQMVYEGYRALARKDRQRIKRIDASRTREEISEEILASILRKVSS